MTVKKIIMKKIIVKKILTLSAIGILSAVIIGHLTIKTLSAQSEQGERPPVPVAVTTIKLQPSYQEWRSFTGRALSGRTSPLGFELSGTLESVSVDIGSRVKKGDRLAALDTARLEANLKRMQAEKTSAEAGLALANQTLKRVQKTFSQGHLSAQRLDEAQANKNQALALLNTLKAGIDAVQIDINKSTITAPFDGVITARMADEGRILPAGQAFLTLVETGKLEAHIGLAPESAAALETGKNYRLLDSSRSDITGATIRTILPVIEGQTRTRLAVFTMPDGRVQDGDLITLLIRDTKQATGAWVPIRALSSDVRGLWRLNKVLKQENGDLRVGFAAVQILYTTGQMAYVTGTLSDGDRIIAGGVDRLAVRERVRIVQSTPAPSPHQSNQQKTVTLTADNP